ncbi:MAG: DNA mismatch repair endonuclease MutH [Myxococcota bacterium]
MTPQPPRSEGELVARAEALAGHTLGELAAQLWVAVPDEPRRAKGWAGTLLERALGATAASRAAPDFPGLGIELKSVSVDARGQPTESTYVCTAPLDAVALGPWRDAWVRHKLQRVLWIPITAGGPLGARTVGAPIPWSPSDDDDALLRRDYTEIAEIVAAGELWQLDARRGEALQVRPKGQDGSDAAWALDEDGGWVRDTPRGFYLRRRFTAGLLARDRVPPGRG